MTITNCKYLFWIIMMIIFYLIFIPTLTNITTIIKITYRYKMGSQSPLKHGGSTPISFDLTTFTRKPINQLLSETELAH